MAIKWKDKDHMDVLNQLEKLEARVAKLEGPKPPPKDKNKEGDK